MSVFGGVAGGALTFDRTGPQWHRGQGGRDTLGVIHSVIVIFMITVKVQVCVRSISVRVGPLAVRPGATGLELSTYTHVSGAEQSHVDMESAVKRL